jgi:Methylamine utilisation protein MauE
VSIEAGQALLLAWVIRAALAVLFAAALWHKARAPREFAEALANYRLLPAALVPYAAGLLLFAEAVVLAGLLATPMPLGPFAALAGVLLLLYALGIAVNLGRGRTSVDCGCHGFSGRQQIAGWMVVRNLILATAAVVLAGVAGKTEALPWPLPTDWVTVGGATAMLCLLYVLLHSLMANASKLAR